jgi:plasmid stabilization system protein ParE
MVKKVRSVIWDKSAVKYLKSAIEFIRKDSPQNAEKLKSELKASILSLSDNPEKNPPDKYRTNNDGSFRAFELYKFRISYYVSATEIRIVRIRHARQEPLNF